MERTIKPEDLKAQFADKFILDVRSATDREAAPGHLPGAKWKNPEQLAVWAKTLPRESEIVVYCAHGGAVSNNVVDALRAKDFKARLIDGGLDGWKAANGEVTCE